MLAPRENAWESWSPETLSEKLSGSNVPWYIAGGWALDLFFGAQSRKHDDLEFVVSPDGARHIASSLPELTFFAAQKGKLSHWNGNSPVESNVWQLWGADMSAGVWRVDMMIERGSAEQWIYKRDQSIKLPRSEAIRLSETEIPYLGPANVLLFKAKHLRAKDLNDFETVLPKLSPKDRENLSIWLNSCHSNHPWLAKLSLP